MRTCKSWKRTEAQPIAFLITKLSLFIPLATETVKGEDHRERASVPGVAKKLSSRIIGRAELKTDT